MINEVPRVTAPGDIALDTDSGSNTAQLASLLDSLLSDPSNIPNDGSLEPSDVLEAMIDFSEDFDDIRKAATFIGDSRYYDWLTPDNTNEIVLGPAQRQDIHNYIRRRKITLDIRLCSRIVSIYSNGLESAGHEGSATALIDYLGSHPDKQRFVRMLQHQIKRRLIDVLDAQEVSENVDGLQSMMEAIERSGISGASLTDMDCVLTELPLVVGYPRMAVLLQEALEKQQATVANKAAEGSLLHLAREILHDLFTKAASDPARDQEKAKVFCKYIFPDRSRPQSMSRSNMLRLANMVAQDRGPNSPEYLESDSGVVGSAAEELLAATRPKDDPTNNEYTDTLYATIVGMLLEMRAEKKR